MQNMSESIPLQTREKISLNVLNYYDMLPFKLNIMHSPLRTNDLKRITSLGYSDVFRVVTSVFFYL